MRVKLQLVMCSGDGHEETVTDIVTLKKDCQRIEHLGLTLKEAKQLLKTTQQRLLQQQVETFLASCSTCPDCGVLLKGKGSHTRSFRTLCSVTPYKKIAHHICFRVVAQESSHAGGSH